MCEVIMMVDASHAVLANMCSHTGGLMSLSVGVLHGNSSKQKLNTRSSTKPELVGISKYLPYTLWLSNFMKLKGFDTLKNVIYQDNMSAIRMERNVRNSCTGNLNHINI